jgi:hypothetical protein
MSKTSKILYSAFWVFVFSFLQWDQISRFLENTATESTVVFMVINTIGIAIWGARLVALIDKEN